MAKNKNKYFTIATGLRGAYLPDNSYIIEVTSKKELKAIVLSEFEAIKEAGYCISIRELVETVNDAWRNAFAIRQSPYAFTIGYGLRGFQTKVNKFNAIQIMHSCKEDFEEQESNHG